MECSQSQVCTSVYQCLMLAPNSTLLETSYQQTNMNTNYQIIVQIKRSAACWEKEKSVSQIKNSNIPTVGKGCQSTVVLVLGP